MTHKRPPPDAQRGPRKRRRATPSVALPLFAWAARQDRAAATAARLTLRHDLRDANGSPRVCIAMPGRRTPLAFPSLSAALAALARMEAADARR